MSLYLIEMSFIWSMIQSFSFVVGMIMGVWLTVSSSNWLGIWAGLELNSICFIPFINMSFKFQKEAGMKYFLIQTFGSYVMLFSGLFFTEFYSLFSLMVSLSLLLKMGMTPFHYWYVSMVEELSWFEYLILSTVQKLGPLFILFYLEDSSLSGFLMYVVIMLSGFIGAVGGMNEFSLRKLFAYSSVHNLGWILILLVEGNELWLVFLFLYFMIFSIIIFNMWFMGIYNLNQMLSFKYFYYEKLNVIVSILSLGGLPPLVGFFPKFLLLHMSFSVSLTFCLFLLIMSSVVMLFIYLRLSYSLMFIISMKKNTSPPKKSFSFFPLLGLSFNFFGFFMMSMLLIYMFSNVFL